MRRDPGAEWPWAETAFALQRTLPAGFIHAF
jgi:hypothetical protein